MAEDKDLFNEAFGEDEDEAAARKAKEAAAGAKETVKKPARALGNGQGKKPKSAGGRNVLDAEAKGSEGEEEADSKEEKDEEQEEKEEDEEDEPDEEEEEDDDKEEDEEKDDEEKEEEPSDDDSGGKKEKGEEEDEEKEGADEEEKKGALKGKRAGKARGAGQKKAGLKAVSAPPEEKPLREKIKKIMVAKAVRAAEKDIVPPDIEVGIREVGVKEGDIPEVAIGLGQAVGAEPRGLVVRPDLKFLQDDKGNAFIGRKKGVFQKYGSEAALFVGRVNEKGSPDKNVCLDSLNPHVVFVCGARGSGKSYVLGVMAEELALKNKNVGVIVVDPVGVFWGMRYPNRETRELEALAKWELLPQGLENLRVFIPEGVAAQVPKSTYDATFSMPPSLLTTEDWCLTFGIERFSPSGLLMEKGLEKVKSGYKTKEGKAVKGKKDLFSLEDLILCLHADEELNSGERGYKADSIRALASRFDAAKNWGVFNSMGTPLVELSREGQLTVIDTSFLEDNVSALVIGILARRILAARKVSTRRESAGRFGKEENVDQLLEFGVPPTWLFIDEAHTLIPSGNVMTPASSALIEYVKQGRQPGCSLVFATQQPSAINTKVLSQLDVVIAHKLVFDDDIKAVYKRVPTIVPKAYKKSNFIKTLPVGIALTGDRCEETSRAFVMRIRPRMSQHEGREAETVERNLKLDDEKVLLLAVEMAKGKLDQVGSISTSTIAQVVETLNAKYRSKIKLGTVLERLEENGAVINEATSTISIPGVEQEEALAEELVGEAEKEVEKEAKAVFPKEMVELLAFPASVNEEKARLMFNKVRRKRLLGLFGEEEAIENVQLRYLPIYRVEYNAFDTKQTFRKAEAFVNSITGEFIHFDNKKKAFVESQGLPLLDKLSQNELKLLMMLGRKKDFAAIAKEFEESKESASLVKRLLQGLEEKGFVAREKVSGTELYARAKPIELPPSPMHPLLSSLSGIPVLNIEAMSLMREAIDREKLAKSLAKLWGNIAVKKIDLVYLPVYETFLRKKDGSVRKIFIEAVTGNQLKLGNKPY
ncbi:MAG: ATP-binding protein [archaeon]